LKVKQKPVLQKNGVMFKRKDQHTHDMHSLGNAPVTSDESDAQKRVFSSLLVAAQVQATRWFLIALVLGLIAAIESIALTSLFPLSKPVPYMVKVDDVNGEIVARPVAASEFKVEKKYVAAEARSLVRNLMTIDPFTTRRDLDRAASRMAGKAIAEFREFLTLERTFERLAKTPGLIRTTEISSVDASQKNIVFVFAQTSERISTGQPIITKWRFTIHYVIEPAVDEKGILENPLGFVVTHFERVQDTIR
jgi:type IV secretory pathway component VirB8